MYNPSDRKLVGMLDRVLKDNLYSTNRLGKLLTVYHVQGMTDEQRQEQKNIAEEGNRRLREIEDEIIQMLKDSTIGELVELAKGTYETYRTQIREVVSDTINVVDKEWQMGDIAKFIAKGPGEWQWFYDYFAGVDVDTIPDHLEHEPVYLLWKDGTGHMHLISDIVSDVRYAVTGGVVKQMARGDWKKPSSRYDRSGTFLYKFHVSKNRMSYTRDWDLFFRSKVSKIRVVKRADVEASYSLRGD